MSSEIKIDNRTFHVTEATDRCPVPLHTFAIQKTGESIILVHKHPDSSEWSVCTPLSQPFHDKGLVRDKQRILAYLNSLPPSRKERIRK